ncbi:hypothetical protein PINS_up007150 [Pythium insidiosum]|nr:hypothetical protein PINS_up007150 [Pythium insidiosum]
MMRAETLLYRALWRLALPLVRVYVRHKDKRRLVPALATKERFGYSAPPSGWNASRHRPLTVWIHGASVGECVSVLPLVEWLLSPRFPSRNTRVVVTTTTPSARDVMRRRLHCDKLSGASMETNPRVTCVFAPLDAPECVERFYDAWRPDVGLWVESELWPTLILEAARRQIRIGIINARLSHRSVERWSLVQSLARSMVSRFSLVLCQDDEQCHRFARLGAKNPQALTNLKFIGTRSEASSTVGSDIMQQAIAARLAWLTVSTHEGEEAMVADIHSRLQQTQAHRVLTVIIPRHPERSSSIIRQIISEHPHLRVSLRSIDTIPPASTDIFIVDTLGETQLFFSLIPTVVVGGSFVRRGGHNPIEPLRNGCHVIVGPHMFNFSDILSQLNRAFVPLVHQVQSPEDLVAHLQRHFENDASSEHVAAVSQRMTELSVHAMSAYERRLTDWLVSDTTPTHPC